MQKHWKQFFVKYNFATRALGCIATYLLSVKLHLVQVVVRSHSSQVTRKSGDIVCVTRYKMKARGIGLSL